MSSVEDAIRAASRSLPNSGDYQRLCDVRRALPSSLDRTSVDAALKRMSKARQIYLEPDSNRKALTADDHDSAIMIGGEPNHLIQVCPETGDHPTGSPEISGPGSPSLRTASELVGYDQLVHVLDTLVADTLAEIDDRRAALSRAHDDVARLDTLVASLVNLDVDAESVAAIHAVADTDAAKMRIASQEVDNAEHRWAQAVNLRAHVRVLHHSLREVYAAAGRDAAAREFYTGG